MQELQTVGKLVGIKELKATIPVHCFNSSIKKSLLWIFHDVLLAITIASLASWFIPQVQNPILRYASWAVYGWLEGLVFTGLWVCQLSCWCIESELLKRYLGTNLGMVHSFRRKILMTLLVSSSTLFFSHHTFLGNLHIGDITFTPITWNLTTTMCLRGAPSIWRQLEPLPGDWMSWPKMHRL